MEENTVKITVQADASQIEAACAKAELLATKIQEAKTLADDLASCISEIALKVNF